MEHDDYAIDESSDDESIASDSSSEDELQTFIRQEFGVKKENKSDDFENEMEQELSKHMRIVEDTILNKDISESRKTDDNTEENSTEEKKNLSNDDLFYDPEMDQNDQDWVDNQRRAYTYQNSQDSIEHRPLPKSDAVLNCPACLSLLCMDCQRHEIYKSQYRAMFVTNCNIDNDQKLYYPIKGKKKSAKNTAPDEYHPVQCSVCNTTVAVYDKEEIYHFFNVISSFS